MEVGDIVRYTGARENSYRKKGCLYRIFIYEGGRSYRLVPLANTWPSGRSYRNNGDGIIVSVRDMEPI